MRMCRLSLSSPRSSCGGERVFTRTLPAGITLLDFVQKEFSEIAPKVRAVLQFDKLILELREAPVE